MDIEKIKSVLLYQHDTGKFYWVKHRPNGVKPGDRADKKINQYEPYRRVTVFGKTYQAHRLAFLLFHGRLPNKQIDHINGDPSDNRICNLREATQTQNNQNRNSLGVTWNKAVSKWQAQIKANGKSLYLGCYENIEIAKMARRCAEKLFFRKFARVQA